MAQAARMMLLLIGGVSLIVGYALSYTAVVRYRSADAPAIFPSFNPRDWKLVWRTRSWFAEERGYRMYLIGSVLLSLGGLAGAVAFLLALR